LVAEAGIVRNVFCFPGQPFAPNGLGEYGLEVKNN
jgi:hypothetical protein